MKNKGLVNYWSFDNCLLDFIGGKNMVMRESASFTNDRNNIVSSALDLNVGYVQAPEGVYFSGDFTITVWVMYRNIYSNFARILEFGHFRIDEVILGVFGTSGCIEFTIYNTNQYIVNKANEPLREKQWYFLSAFLKDSKATIYYNGILKHEGRSYRPKNITSSTNYIGKSIRNYIPNTNGKIDELRIFNRALTESEILEEMNAN